MKRELSEMDRLADNYHMALKKLEPQLKDRIKREKAISLKEKLLSKMLLTNILMIKIPSLMQG